MDGKGTDMDPVLVVLLVVGVLAALVAVWWVRRGRDGASGADAGFGPPEQLDHPAAPPEPHAFDRQWLLNRSREFDPGAWDDTPDGTGGAAAPRPAAPRPAAPGEEPGEEPPQRFDRAFLERREQERRDPS